MPTKNSRLCSVHFSKDQLDRDLDKLRENGYDGAKIRLKSDAHPDIPLLLQQPEAISLPQAKPGGGFAMRQRAEILRQVLQEVKRRNEGQCTANQEEPEVPPSVQEDPPPADEVTVAATSTQMEKKCQVDIRPPQRTRRIQVSMTDQKPVKTVSTGAQCSSLSDGVPLPVAAGLAPHPVPPQPEENDSDSDEDDHGDHDPDYAPLDQTEDVEDYHHGSYTLRSDAPPEEERRFLVSESCLASILGKYDLCEEPCEPVVQFIRGTMIGTVSTCTNGHTTQW